MAKEEDKKPVEQAKPVEEIQTVSKSVHKVKKQFTLDKLYNVGSTIELPDGKIKDTLISNKFI